MKLLSGKKILITGITNKMSIAYGIAKTMHEHDAILSFTYQNIKIKNKIKKLTKEFKSTLLINCDVTSDTSIKKLFLTLSKKWNTFDCIVHSIAYSPNYQLYGSYIDSINRNDFQTVHDITSYSFVALAKYGINYLNSGSSLITISYLGSQRAIQNYNIMGVAKASLESNVRYMSKDLGPMNIRVNAISSGPIKTISSSCIKNFRRVFSDNASNSPLRKNVTIKDIGNVAVFLSSNLSSSITGQIIYVDGGFSII
ncbi:Enoyl-[acyl-carrier-protein] reductase [NADH] FabI [Buchnera aphidicola (Neophyllaphis podocarpi)]|uniref:enoyl-ACP reductase FabI n=1 Tax=Buchnera aphidicola TaxID=9 RepID=UPI0034646F76